MGLKRSMRQIHIAGEKLFVDYAGQTVPIIDAATGEITKAQIFVAVCVMLVMTVFFSPNPATIQPMKMGRSVQPHLAEGKNMTEMHNTEHHRAALLGAFDRFNYGDLLFPIIVGNEMGMHCPDLDIAVHALVESDLSQFGALKTQSFRTLNRPGVLAANDLVIFAGGGTIGARWTDMHKNLLGSTGNAALYYLQRIFGSGAADAVSRVYFGGLAPFPWVAGPEDFAVPVKVAYNAVGGSEFGHLAPELQERILGRLGKATYLSVRDAETKRLLGAVEETVGVNLAPDSAILMSEQFPVTFLQSRASESLKQMIEDGPYVCFQSHVRYATRNSDKIVEMLGNLYERFGLRALLLPIGRYVGLDDQMALHNIREKLRSPSSIVSDQASIWEIMLVIARASLFLGTSLHGNVTSQSFAVPHLGLGSSQKNKLDFYLETWDLSAQARCVAPDKVCQIADRVLAVPELARQTKRAELIEFSHENFRKMAIACGLDWRNLAA